MAPRLAPTPRRTAVVRMRPQSTEIVERVTIEERHSVLGVVCGHREYLTCAPADLVAAVWSDPSLAGLAWVALAGRLVTSRFLPLVVVTPDNVDVVAADILATLSAMTPA